MGEAGFGAEEQASRRARRVAQLRAEESRAASLDADVQAQLARAQRDQRAWSAGAEGERQVAAAIESLPRYGWTSLHDLHWPGRPQANLDHVALGPGGVVLVDAKNWSGDVVVRDGRLRQNGYDRTAQVESVAHATADLTAELAPQHRSAVRGVVCLAGQDVEPTVLSGGVVVVGRAQLSGFLVSLEPRLSPFDVADLGRYLLSHLGGPVSPGVARAGGPARSTTRTSGKPRPLPRRPSQRAPRDARRRPAQRQSVAGVLFRLAVGVGALVVLVNMLPRVIGP